jgi:hypothetical protein
MNDRDLVSSEWGYVLSVLPGDLEEGAVEKLAIQRRRHITSAADLLRLILAYSLCDFSLRQTAAWAKLIGLADVSDVAVLKRLKSASDWVAHLVMQCLRLRGLASPRSRLRIRVVDATTVAEPGSKGTDWRLHLGLDLATETIIGVEVTGAEGGETLTRHPVEQNEVFVADRGYAHREGAASVLRRQGHVLLRINAQNFPLETRTGVPLDLLTSLETLGPNEIGDWPVAFRAEKVTYPIRLLAMRRSQAAIEKEQRRIARLANKRGNKTSEKTMRCAHFIVLVTDLPPAMLPTHEAFELYRLRWQIEIAFKRLKSLLHLDRLRAQDPALVRCYLYGKILSAILLDDLIERLPAFSPWGFPLVPSPTFPLALVTTLD